MGSPIIPGARRALTNRKRIEQGAGSQSSSLSNKSASQPRITDIIVPVYAGKEETLACLESVFRTTDHETTEIVVVNDASPDLRLVEALQGFAAEDRITLISNSSNLGFSGAANRGLRLHPDRDVILLNSDTEVFGDWIRRLTRSANGSPDIGSVTPMGENGSITDYSPGSSGKHATPEEIDRVASQVNAGRAIEIPVAVGFCMYIKRKCLDETGDLDAATFARGYGEENDFCLRARNLGWRHMAATDVFVGHHGGRSFGGLAAVLKRRNSRVLNALYPEYLGLIEAFSASDPLAESRRAIDITHLLDNASEPVLLITHDLHGGVMRHISERQAELNAAGHTVLVLQPSTPRNAAPRVTIAVDSLGPKNLTFDVLTEFIRFEQLLRELRLFQIEIHHLLGVPSPIIGALMRLGVPYDIYLHDYSWICPRIALIDGSGKYCGEPALAECEACIRNHGSEMEESLTVALLRERSAKLLLDARRVIVPSSDARERFARYFPEREFETTPWELMPNLAFEPRPSSAYRARVAVIGGIGIPKGYKVLLDCARDAAARNLDLQFIVIGYTVDDQALLDTGRVFVTGPYRDEEVGMLLDRERCNVAFIPSISPETWCYSLTHAITRNLPIIAFNLGAQAERLGSYSSAELLSLSCSAQQVNSALTGAINRPSSGRAIEEGFMEQEELAEQQQTKEIRSEDLASSVQIVKLPQGIYSCTVKEGGASRHLTETLALPALQVGIAPVKSSGKVEILSGASNLDRWLAYEDDLIVVRIAGGEGSLLLTSVRAKDSPSLAVGIERLNTQTARQDAGLETSAGEFQSQLEMRLLAHIRYVGDISVEGSRIGWPGKRMWIEGFAISSIGGLPADCVEYRGVISSGIPTPWLRSQALCGSKGGGLPLVGYAVRLQSEFAE
ncbi:MAG: glycosyltransferase, partial [Terracidiphilus sp.]